MSRRNSAFNHVERISALLNIKPRFECDLDDLLAIIWETEAPKIRVPEREVYAENELGHGWELSTGIEIEPSLMWTGVGWTNKQPKDIFISAGVMNFERFGLETTWDMIEEIANILRGMKSEGANVIAARLWELEYLEYSGI